MDISAMEMTLLNYIVKKEVGNETNIQNHLKSSTLNHIKLSGSFLYSFILFWLVVDCSEC